MLQSPYILHAEIASRLPHQIIIAQFYLWVNFEFRAFADVKNCFYDKRLVCFLIASTHLDKKKTKIEKFRAKNAIVQKLMEVLESSRFFQPGWMLSDKVARCNFIFRNTLLAVPYVNVSFGAREDEIAFVLQPAEVVSEVEIY